MNKLRAARNWLLQRMRPRKKPGPFAPASMRLETVLGPFTNFDWSERLTRSGYIGGPITAGFMGNAIAAAFFARGYAAPISINFWQRPGTLLLGAVMAFPQIDDDAIIAEAVNQARPMGTAYLGCMTVYSSMVEPIPTPVSYQASVYTSVRPS